MAVTDAMVEAVRDIDMAACYGTEEDPAAGPDMLRTIGEIARKALAEIDSAQTKLKSRTRPAPAAPAVPADWNLVLRDLVALEADGKHADESAVEVWERARATLAADAPEVPR